MQKKKTCVPILTSIDLKISSAWISEEIPQNMPLDIGQNSSCTDEKTLPIEKK